MDLNGDGITDLASGSSEGMTVVLSNPAGGWSPISFMDPQVQLPLAIGDYDGDGRFDLACFEMGDLAFLTDWTSTTRVTDVALDDPWPGHWAAPIDIDGDGNLDVASTSSEWEFLELFTRSGSSLSQVSRQRVPLPHASLGIASGDLDADGDWDLVVSYSSVWPVCCNQALGVFLGDGMGGFQYTEHPLPFLDNYSGVRLADMDGDEDLDIVLHGSYLTIVKNLLIP
jgi:hypothetical protein